MFYNKLDSFPETGTYEVCIGTKEGYSVDSIHTSKVKALMRRDELLFNEELIKKPNIVVFIQQTNKI